MKQIITLLVLTIFLGSCSKKNVLLPATENSNITEIKDVSAIYLFYDETKKDSLEFNRKNIISTTNWLVNIDKRLTLKQILPHLVYLQNKRNKDGMHKNRAAKNYFTCSNPSIENLAFIEFTEVVYHDDSFQIFLNKMNDGEGKHNITFFRFNNEKTVTIGNRKISIEALEEYIQTTSLNKIIPLSVYLVFSENLSFQNYITIKSLLLKLNLDKVIIESHEFIYN